MARLFPASRLAPSTRDKGERMSSGSPAFDALCRGLVTHTTLNYVQARGTVRLVLREVGIGPAELTKKQAAALIDKAMPARLVRQGVEQSQTEMICVSLQGLVNAVEEGSARE